MADAEAVKSPTSKSPVAKSPAGSGVVSPQNGSRKGSQHGSRGGSVANGEADERAETGHLAGDRLTPEIGLAKDADYTNAKSYLLQQMCKDGGNLYDHLSKVITRILTERPNNSCDIFEDLSKDVKRTEFRGERDTMKEQPDISSEVALAEVQKRLFSRSGEDEAEGEDAPETPLPNLWDLVFYFEQAGVGVQREEVYRVWLALKQLVDTQPLQHVRFWGKIFGTEQNYYVAEVEYREGEGEEEEEENEEDTKDEPEKEDGEEGEEEEEDVLPKPDWKAPPLAPKEERGSGANKKTYYVCNDPGKPWVKLPQVTPQQISGARAMKKFFTGRLDAPIITYPPFIGNEAAYLRAQIARISAGTHIAPQGFYSFDDEEEEADEEEGAGRDTFVVVEDFQPIPVREMAEPTMANWVHIVQHVLKQGRCAWWNPAQKSEDEFEGEDEEEEREEPDEPQREDTVPLLTPVSEDVTLDGTQPWTAHVSSKLIPQYAIAVAHSNLWPGAHAFSFEKKFENVYIGWGLKYAPTNFNPELPPPIMEEFPSGPEVSEIEDPTPEEEAALRAAGAEAEEGEEEGEEEEEVEEDD